MWHHSVGIPFFSWLFIPVIPLSPDSWHQERKSMHPVWTDRSRASTAPRMHSVSAQGHSPHTFTHKHTPMETYLTTQLKAKGPRSQSRLKSLPNSASMTSKKQRWGRLAISHSSTDVYSTLMHHCIILFCFLSNCLLLMWSLIQINVSMLLCSCTHR